MATIQIPDESEPVLSRLEELEDVAIATERLNSPGTRLSLEEVKKDLGLAD